MQVLPNRVLLINLPYYEDIFGRSTVKAAVSPSTIIMSLATIASAVREAGLEVHILDLNISKNASRSFSEKLIEFRPGYIGFTFTTAIFHIAKRYASMARDLLPHITVIGGGPHSTVLPEEVLRCGPFDMVLRGEGDFALCEIVTGSDLSSIPGVSFRIGEDIVHNPARPNIPNLDSLPLPALDLYDVQRYRHPNFIARRNPVASMETSRGCYGACKFCSSRLTKFRVKSVDRVIAEMEFILSLGFREIHLVDDMFTADIKRVKKICQAIIDSRLDISWYPRGGIRVDHVDQEMFHMMKRAGVWSVAYGIESGNQQILDNIEKRITLDQIRHAIRLAKNAGLSVDGYFMLGHPGETEATIKDTIKFSTSLGLDYAKYAINIPLPGTPQFDIWEKQGVIKTRDWTKYTFSTPPSEIYDHPTVDWRIIEKYYRQGPRKFYLRPSYVLRRVIKDARSGRIFANTRTLLKSLPQWTNFHLPRRQKSLRAREGHV
ncbi:MAG TPA: radical SAM protein [Pyrinomonadaceae bacterium]|nr:radical SAM protein [Pyrinomonadaceae bacterium]